ncbi:MAG: universal stress family protein [Myxococcales bacterium]|nr:universal stress family protein [Myxococcales bacterium]
MTDIRKILVPVDFSDGASVALELAASFAKTFGASVELLHVWTPPLMVPIPIVVVTPRSDQPLSLEELASTTASAQMKDLVEQLRKQGIETQARVGIGSPAHEIVELATLGHFDLIVMGTHGHGGLAHALLGSVAEKVVRRASCPVLTVRAPKSK